MFAWLLLSLLAAISAQTLCNPLSATDDLAAAVVADIETIVREADLTVDTSATLTVSNKEEYDAAVDLRFHSNVELTTEQNAQIDAAVTARLDAVIGAFPALQRDTILLCLSVKKDIIVGIVTDITDAVNELLVTYYDAFVAYKVVLNAYLNAWVNIVATNDETQIISAQITFQAKQAVQLSGDIAFYIKNQEQKVRQATLVVANATYDYLVAVRGGVQADITAKRAAAEVAVKAVIVAQIDWRRAQELEEVVKARIEVIKNRLDQAKVELQTAAQRQWAEVRAEIVAAFQAVADKIEEHRQRLADYLAGLRCDLSSAELTLVGAADGNEAAVKVEIRAVTCYDTEKSEADYNAAFCASIRAYFVNEGATATSNTYACAVVSSQKRALEQGGGQTTGADITAEDPNGGNPPPPTGASGSASVVSCIVLLLVAFLFHF